MTQCFCRQRVDLTLHPFPKGSCIDGLNQAIEDFNTMMSATTPGYNFREVVVPKIIGWATELETDPLVPMLQGNGEMFSLSRQEIRYILANAFLLNVKPPSVKTLGSLSLTKLYSNRCPESVQRLICFLAYFEHARYISENELVRFWRFSKHSLELPALDHNPTVLNTMAVNLSVERMEDISQTGDWVVDFANKQLHIGEIIPSLTQEEVLFSIFPEAFVGLLCFPTMDDQEVIVIQNVLRVSKHTGYQGSFRFDGIYPEIIPQTILAMDACMVRHFEKGSIDRDLTKAYIGFHTAKKLRANRVITGHWGCGAFGGDKSFKFLQQLCASSLAGLRNVQYSCFGSNADVQKLTEIAQRVKLAKCTVGQVYQWMCDYSKHDRTSFHSFIMSKLS